MSYNKGKSPLQLCDMHKSRVFGLWKRNKIKSFLVQKRFKKQQKNLYFFEKTSLNYRISKFTVPTM